MYIIFLTYLLPRGSESRAVGPVGKMNKERNHTLGTKAQNMHQLIVLANGTYALALGRDTKPEHHGLVRPDSRRQNLIFFTNRKILHTLKKEPLNIMLLHTSRTMEGP